jgi:hypothetical protein
MKDSLKKFRLSGRAGMVARVLIWVAVGVLLATPPSRPWPVDVGVRADSDTTVVVTWYSQEEHRGFGCEPPKPDPYDSFELFFQPVGESSWTSVGRTRDTFMVHDPQHFTGRYSVRGWRGSEENWDTWTYATTEPLHIGPVRLREVSTGDTSALGFSYTWDHGGHVFVMDDSTGWWYPDAYVTDYKVGSPGPLLIVSPSLAFGDPGVHVSDYSDWHTTWFSAPLPDERSLMPSWEPFTWTQVCSLPYTPLLVACRREWNNYALIKVLSNSHASIELEAWYQRVNGLRLTGH